MIFLFLLSSCAYPDIDTVPDFKDVKLTLQESIEFCKFKNPYIKSTTVTINVVAVPTVRNIYINNSYKRLKCFEKLNKITSRL